MYVIIVSVIVAIVTVTVVMPAHVNAIMLVHVTVTTAVHVTVTTAVHVTVTIVNVIVVINAHVSIKAAEAVNSTFKLKLEVNSMKLKFNVNNRGLSYEVIGINQNESDFDACETLQVFSWDVFETVANALLDGKKVLLPKNLERDYDVTDIVIEQPDQLMTTKNIAILKIKDLIYNTRINKTAIMDIYNYHILHDWFADKGIIITADNREEKYMEVIDAAADMDNTDLANEYTNNLGKMLDVKDKIEDIYGVYVQMNQYISAIEDAETEQEINDIYDKALNEYK